MDFVIRDLKTYDEMLQVHQVQQEIWGTQGTNLGLYPPVLNTAAKNGGTVLAAFDANTDQMVAFLFGFLGKGTTGPLKLCSQTMGVLPNWRNAGVGEALKQAQRERALAQGLPLITWTYDPLETRNAYLNIRKLGGIIRTYYRNVYGDNFGAINAGLPSDRLEVEWWIAGKHVTQPRPIPDYSQANPIFEMRGVGVEKQVEKTNMQLNAPILQLEMLTDIQALKQVNLPLAQDWRLKVRTALETYFAQGYLITDFRSMVEDGERINCYILQKLTPPLTADIGLLA